MPIDYFGNSIKVGDTVTIMAVDSRGGTPLWASAYRMTVVKLGRTRVEVTGPFNGTIRPTAEFVRVVP